MEGHFIQAGSRGETPGGQGRREDKPAWALLGLLWEAAVQSSQLRIG